MATEAKKATKIALSKDATRHDLMRAAVDVGIAQMRGNLRAARRGDDPEAIHQLRVGVRRMRVALRLFRKQLSEETQQKLGEDLRWIFRSLGAARDYDVLLGELDAITPEAKERDAVRAGLSRVRSAALRKARRDLKSARFDALVRSLRRLSIALAADERPSPRARKWSKKRMQKRLDAVLAGRGALDGHDPEALHELRKDLKKLRYAADIVGTLFPGKRTKRYLKRLSTLQDVLGPINDAAVGSGMLMETSGALSPEPARVAREAAQLLDQRGASARGELIDTFDEFADKKPFWK